MTAPHSAGYVNVGDLELYYERHGRGAPPVLLHGAMGTIESCFASLLPALADRYDVLAVELQGHGHTRDVVRPPRARRNVMARRVPPRRSDPDAWTSLVAKANELDRAGVSLPRDRLASLRAPTMLIIGDSPKWHVSAGTCSTGR